MRLHRHAARGAGIVLHRLASIALGIAVVASVLIAAGAWRLSRGPVDLDWFTRRLEAAANANNGPARLSIGGTALAWEGFRLGVDRPLDLRLTNVRLTNAGGLRTVEIPRAEVSLSFLSLLVGRVQPRAVELDDARLTLLRAPDGTFSVDFGSLMPPMNNAVPAGNAPAAAIGEPLPALLAFLARPPTSDTNTRPGWFSQLRRVRVHDAVVTVVDQRLGATWQVPRADVTLTRRPQGGIEGVLDLSLALGDQQARLIGTATLSRNATETHVAARLSPIEPAALAKATPALAFLATIDAPVTTEATAELGPTLALQQARVSLQARAGSLHIGGGSVPIAGASLVAWGTPDDVHIEQAQLQLRAHATETPSLLTATGTVQRETGQIEADLSLGLDQVAFADLSTLWPPGLATDARTWVVQNITGGIAGNGQVQVGLEANGDLSDVTLTRASGSLDGNGLEVSWLAPVPPIVQGQAVLRILDPDTLQIAVASGQQMVGSGKGLAITGGSMRIAGLMQHHQVARIQLGVAGALPDVISLLRQPRLELLSSHPIKLSDPVGDVVASVTATVPLEKAVSIDDIAIQVDAHVDNTFLGGVIAGHDLAGGTLDVAASNAGLTVKGRARLAGIPASLDAAMDFRAGPPTQVVQRVTVAGQTDVKQLAAAGFDATEFLAGPIGLRAVLARQRDGDDSATIDADLSKATLAVAPLDWRKPLGAGAHASARLLLRQDQLDGIDAISAVGDGVSLRASATCNDGRIAMLRLDRLVLGRSDVEGTIAFPGTPRQGSIAVRLIGPVLDLAARLERPSVPHPRPHVEPPPGPPWTLDARFGRVLMAHGYIVAPLRVTAENDGRVFQRLDVNGFTGDEAPFALEVGPQGGIRHLTATVARTGDLLRALDVTGTMQAGKLTLEGTYDDRHPGHVLHGTAELTDFRVARAAALGKLLQAMTLYGLVDALRGPGLGFSRLVAPFSFSDGTVDLTDARAFSPSLGLTAKGSIDLDENTADLQGTIVPAYFFNSLLGDVPVVGRLFSPERGGGVFAASYSLRGKLDDPAVSVNPLAALTPGVLRGLFRLF